ncbi:CvpA family protein [Natranaerobius trueperi]|uniref:Colicin V production protein n=1 Tax=Natranaerobius trueperi TaxID=759412 RepID=A0A226BWR6_9FIRM|nr:CvpA family protein [Natranaerobius trueperi]OWZ83488.1 hypothetical protein CDO51_08300 [Natranaerobius trueperi]
MNLFDLFVMVWTSWYAVSGFLKGYLATFAGCVGAFFSLLLASWVHRPSAETITSYYDYELNSSLVDYEVNLTSLIDMGVGKEVISSWYLKDEKEQEVVPVESLETGEITHVIETSFSEIIIFFIINVLCFIITYFTFRKLIYIIMDIIFEKRKKHNFLASPSAWGGALVGISQGLIIVSVWLFLILLITPFGIPYQILRELQNSYIGYLLIELISKLLY